MRDLKTDKPDWQRLTNKQVSWMKTACEKRKNSRLRKSEYPLLEGTIFYILLHTGLRESELCDLNLEQYHYHGFHQVKRKGQRIEKKIYLPSAALQWLDDYLDNQRGQELGPLLITRLGRRISPRYVQRAIQRLVELAGAHLKDNCSGLIT